MSVPVAAGEVFVDLLHDVSSTFALRTPRHQDITEVHGEYPILFKKVKLAWKMNSDRSTLFLEC